MTVQREYDDSRPRRGLDFSPCQLLKTWTPKRLFFPWCLSGAPSAAVVLLNQGREVRWMTSEERGQLGWSLSWRMFGGDTCASLAWTGVPMGDMNKHLLRLGRRLG